MVRVSGRGAASAHADKLACLGWVRTGEQEWVKSRERRSASLASRPIRIVIADEVDRYPQSAGTEGDPVKLAETRTVAFWNARLIEITSPGTRGLSRIEGDWEKSDQRLYFVPCPDCGEFQTLRWDHVHWEKDEEGNHLPETAVYGCESCGALWASRL